MSMITYQRVGAHKYIVLSGKHIVSAQLTRGKITAFVDGISGGENIVVKGITVREPWTIVLETTTNTYYLNFPDIDKALDTLAELTEVMQGELAIEGRDHIRKELKEFYEQQEKRK